MPGNRGGGDPFMGFGGGFGGFGSHRSLISSFFGGRDPFDDPFFTQPFGGMMGPNFFGSMPSPFMDMHPAGFIENHPQQPENHPQQPKRSRGPIIEELNSDDEQEADQGKAENPRKHARSSNGPRVEDPSEEGRSRSQLQSLDNYRRQSQGISQPRGHSFSFQSSTVTYGGANGAYHTSSTTRRTGSDGLTFEERKEADSSTMQASHRVSRGIHNKGHSMARNLNSDGKVETMETLHNLNQDDLVGFEEAWKGKARKHLPGWTDHSNSYHGRGASGSRGPWALPSTERSSPMVTPHVSEAARPSNPRPSGKMKAEFRGKGGRSRGRSGGQ